MKRGLICGFLFFCLAFQAQQYKKLRQDAADACKKGQYKDAIRLSEEALNQLRSKKTSESEKLVLRSENAVYYVFDEQVQKGLNLLAVCSKESQNHSAGTEAQVLKNYATGLIFLGAFAEAKPLLEKAQPVYSASGFPVDEYLSLLTALAACYHNTYDFVSSEKTYIKTVSLIEKEKTLTSIDVAAVYSGLALLYRDMLRNREAENLYEKAYKVFLADSDTLNPQFPALLSDMGTLMAEQYRFKEALQLIRRAIRSDLSIYGEHSFTHAADLNNLGYTYNRMNNLAEAEQCYKASMQIKKKLQHQRVDSWLTSVNNLLSFYVNTGRETDAKLLAEELGNSFANNGFTDTLKRAVFANNLGIYYKNWGNYERSQFFLNESLKYYAAMYGDNNPFAAELFLDLALVDLARQDTAGLRSNLEKAASAYKGGNDINTSVNLLCNLAMILKELGQTADAFVYITKALKLSNQSELKDRTVREQLLITSAQVYAEAGRTAESIAFFNTYLEGKYSSLEKDFSYMTETEKLFFIEEFDHQVTQFYSVVLSHIDQQPELVKNLLDFRIRSKSVLFNNLSKTKQKINTLNDPGLFKKYEQLIAARENLGKYLSFETSALPDAESRAQQLKDDCDRLEKEISKSIDGSTIEEPAVNWRQIQKTLSPHEAAVEVVRTALIYDNNQGKGINYTFLVIKSEGEPQVVSVDRPENWETTVLAHYRRGISKKLPDGSIYARIWQFLDKQLSDCHTLYVSPDGIYTQLNLNTLYNSAAEKYLLEEKNIHIIDHLRSIKTAKQNMPLPHNAVIAGNPQFSQIQQSPGKPAVQNLQRNAYGLILSELPGTQTEAENISSLLKSAGIQTSVYTGSTASEANIKKLSSPDILHMATHGFFLKNPDELTQNGFNKLKKDHFQNPLLRCGLFFSGANTTFSLDTKNIAALDTLEDGVLTAFEAMNLNLEGTQLVVLSACETGLGEIKNSEGVFGLPRAFRLAGANCVLMSMWPVSDDATRDLMTLFYQKWMQNKDIYTAFREAQIEIKQTYPEPQYWGAFVLTGK